MDAASTAVSTTNTPTCSERGSLPDENATLPCHTTMPHVLLVMYDDEDNDG